MKKMTHKETTKNFKRRSPNDNFLLIILKRNGFVGRYISRIYLTAKIMMKSLRNGDFDKILR